MITAIRSSSLHSPLWACVSKQKSSNHSPEKERIHSMKCGGQKAMQGLCRDLRRRRFSALS